LRLQPEPQGIITYNQQLTTISRTVYIMSNLLHFLVNNSVSNYLSDTYTVGAYAHTDQSGGGGFMRSLVAGNPADRAIRKKFRKKTLPGQLLNTKA